MEEVKIGIIGGSGLYQMGALEDIRKVDIPTPYGEPSDSYIIGRLEGKPVAFLPRHARGHIHLPSEINCRANIWGLKKLGVEWIIAVSAVGSLKEKLKPMDIVLPDQFFDRTNQGRKGSFFGDGIAAHIAFADPTCRVLRDIIFKVTEAMGIRVHKGGTYINMEGPAFSTRAESNVYRSWGMDVIGMTNMTEARLAREAEISYQTVAMVTDYDCWRSGEGYEDVSVTSIQETFGKNIETARSIIRAAVAEIPSERDCPCSHALEGAIMTAPEMITPEVRQRVALLVGKYLD